MLHNKKKFHAEKRNQKLSLNLEVASSSEAADILPHWITHTLISPKKDMATVIDVLKQEFQFIMTHVATAFSEIKSSVNDMTILPEWGVSSDETSKRIILLWPGSWVTARKETSCLYI